MSSVWCAFIRYVNDPDGSWRFCGVYETKLGAMGRCDELRSKNEKLQSMLSVAKIETMVSPEIVHKVAM